jgi:hypothetical protein
VWGFDGGDAYLVLDEELDTLDGSSSRLRDGGRHTSHKEIDYETLVVR